MHRACCVLEVALRPLPRHHPGWPDLLCPVGSGQPRGQPVRPTPWSWEAAKPASYPGWATGPHRPVPLLPG